jgi:ABC-type enterochelin transport system substrate-binding protein
MKKVFMLLIASAALTMTACGGKDEKAAASAEATMEAEGTMEAEEATMDASAE